MELRGEMPCRGAIPWEVSLWMGLRSFSFLRIDDDLIDLCSYQRVNPVRKTGKIYFQEVEFKLTSLILLSSQREIVVAMGKGGFEEGIKYRRKEDAFGFKLLLLLIKTTRLSYVSNGASCCREPPLWDGGWQEEEIGVDRGVSYVVQTRWSFSRNMEMRRRGQVER